MNPKIQSELIDLIREHVPEEHKSRAITLVERLTAEQRILLNSRLQGEAEVIGESKEIRCFAAVPSAFYQAAACAGS